MRHGIVEGEPGIFPQPIADLMRKIGNLFDRRKRRDSPPPADTAEADKPTAEGKAAPADKPDGEAGGHTGN